MNHPELEILADMVSRPENPPAPDIVSHVSACAACRKHLARFSRLQYWVQHSVAQPVLSDEQWQNVVDYVDERLTPDMKTQMAEQLRASKPQLKAALHYAAGRSRYPAPGTGAQDQSSARGKARSATPGWLRSLHVWFRQPSPIWTGLSATAVAVLLLAVVVRPVFMMESQNGLALAPYQDAAEIPFTAGPQTPGMGFFSGARGSEQQPFKGVELAIDSNDHITMRWPQVSGAASYHLALFVTEGTVLKLVTEQNTGTNAAQLELGPSGLIPGSRYQWQLRGRTDSGREFTAQGGFVPVSINHH